MAVQVSGAAGTRQPANYSVYLLVSYKTKPIPGTPPSSLQGNRFRKASLKPLIYWHSETFNHSTEQETLESNKEKPDLSNPCLCQRFIEKGKLGKSWGCRIQAAFVTPFGQVTVSNGIGYKELKEKEKRNKVSLSAETGFKLLLLYDLYNVSFSKMCFPSSYFRLTTRIHTHTHSHPHTHTHTPTPSYLNNTFC